MTLHDFSFELKNTDTSKLKPHEKDILGVVFSDMTVGNIQKLSGISRTTASIIIQKTSKELVAALTTENGLIEPSGKRWSVIYSVVGSIFIAGAFFIHVGLGWTLGMLMAAVSFLAFAAVMQRRSHAGVEAYEHIKGLELYMKTAEADRLKMMQSVTSPYNEPEKTFHLFEKLLPFAVALGVERSWAKQFDGLFDKAPDWYQGNGASAFSTGYFASSLSAGVGAFSQSFSSQNGSSSSGSGGGGSSGGGGGGGGGGGW